MKKMTFAVLGFGNRGTVYSNIILKNSDKMEVVAICDINPKKVKIAAEKYGVEKSKCFYNADQFLAAGRLADVLIISTSDSLHYDYTMTALDIGYDILLEKPIAPTEMECKKIHDKAVRLNRKICICHVLRYTPFYQTIKEILDSKRLGNPVTMTQTENIGYWHFAHSFVRGNWGNTARSSPMILAKCCHDLDIIKWLMGEHCLKVSSFGSLTLFKKENEPEGAASHCFECKHKDTCAFDAINFYVNTPVWAEMTGTYYGDGSPESIKKCFEDKNNPYSRCVYKCDNDVADHQVVNMLFDNEKTAQLTVTAFTRDFRRQMKIHCTNGEIEGDIAENLIKVTPFRKPTEYIDLTKTNTELTHHSGGDVKMMADLYNYFSGSEMGKGLTTITNSLESHIMAFAAEKSRLSGGKPVKIK